MEHIQQKDHDGCTHACVAMVTGEDYDEVRLQTPHAASTLEILYLLAANGAIGIIQPLPNEFVPGMKYIVTVPSLNIKGGNHCVVVFLQQNSLMVFDPNRNLPGKLWYSSSGYDDNLGKYPLTSWTEAIRVYDNPLFVVVPAEDE